VREHPPRPRRQDLWTICPKLPQLAPPCPISSAQQGIPSLHPSPLLLSSGQIHPATPGNLSVSPRAIPGHHGATRGRSEEPGADQTTPGQRGATSADQIPTQTRNPGLPGRPEPRAASGADSKPGRLPGRLETPGGFRADSIPWRPRADHGEQPLKTAQVRRPVGPAQWNSSGQVAWIGANGGQTEAATAPANEVDQGSAGAIRSAARPRADRPGGARRLEWAGA
jgi:hypothetical protein